MARRKVFTYEHQRIKKKTNQGCGKYSKGMKKNRGQGGPRKRSKLPKK